MDSSNALLKQLPMHRSQLFPSGLLCKGSSAIMQLLP